LKFARRSSFNPASLRTRPKNPCLGAVHAQNHLKLLFLALEEIQSFFQPLMARSKDPGEKEDAEVPGVAGYSPAADAVLARLVALDAAAIIVLNRGSAGSHVSPIQKSCGWPSLRKVL